MTEKPQSEQSLDSRLDEALEMTFPASDLIAVDSPDPRSIHCIGALRVNRHIYLKATKTLNADGFALEVRVLSRAFLSNT